MRAGVIGKPGSPAVFLSQVWPSLSASNQLSPARPAQASNGIETFGSASCKSPLRRRAPPERTLSPRLRLAEAPESHVKALPKRLCFLTYSKVVSMLQECQQAAVALPLTTWSTEVHHYAICMQAPGRGPKCSALKSFIGLPGDQ